MTDRRHRQKELRSARLEAERKKAARRELRRRLLIALGIGLGLAALFLLTGVLGNRPAGLPSSYLAFRDQPTACGATAPPEQNLMSFAQPEDQGIDPQQPLQAIIRTSCGDIVISLDPTGYPQTVNSFVFLARQGFYDGTVIHRVAAEFVIQGGDQQANGTGTPGYRVPNEFPPAGFVYEKGVVAMANASGITGSQFFIVVGDRASALTNSFSVLGRVVEGDDTLSAIAEVPTALQSGTTERSKPLETIYIEEIEISG
jgi:cyclophilin family peptidyl-prolyl cis-trans isomerase